MKQDLISSLITCTIFINIFGHIIEVTHLLTDHIIHKFKQYFAVSIFISFMPLRYIARDIRVS